MGWIWGEGVLLLVHARNLGAGGLQLSLHGLLLVEVEFGIVFSKLFHLHQEVSEMSLEERKVIA